ncbi:MAG: type I DNA topoisomerase, partial [Erysipelotrichaceae bacterium]|nr:type I DNA topoisomerase [Erysipelotrichaceae bacterium]
VESPSKSKTIEKYLGKDCKVVSSKGHIRDLSTRGKGGLGVDIEDGFRPDYVVSKDKKDVVKQLKDLASKSDEVLLATDPDREGEAISWHLAEELGLDKDDNNRIVFNEITKNAVLHAIDNPRKIDIDLVKSQETRRILDRIIGFRLSNLLKRKIRSQSAGRVQSVALRMICDREKEIENFVPEEYWTIKALLKKDKAKFETTLAKIAGKKAEIKNEEEADKVLSRVKDPFIVADVIEKKKKRSPYLPFITSTMQQEASSKLGFSAKKTMMLAQNLYEGIDLGSETVGLITYMRTDSTRLSDEFVAAAFAKIESEYGKEYKGFYRVKNDGSSQDAHEAIRPTSLANTPEKVREHLSNDQYKLYKFIYARALASLMAEAVNKTVAYEIECEDLLFTVNGIELLFDGFLKVYKDYDSSKDVILSPLNKGDELSLVRSEKEQHFTEGPGRYTEAKLIKALEEEGVGRPSTYATIIDTICNRDYVELKKESEKSKTKYFFPTDKGKLTDEKLREFFNSVINVKYTAQMEDGLDQIAEAKEDNIEYLKNFYNEFQPLVDTAYEKMEKKEDEKSGNKCPLCGSDLVYKDGKYGRFEACSNYPKCNYIASEEVGRDCPDCGAKLIYRNGRYGRFISCSNYPDCKYIEKIAQEKPEETGRACPECGKPLLKRKSRYGSYFIGCSGFPKCKYIENIEGEKKPRYSRKKK